MIESPGQIVSLDPKNTCRAALVAGNAVGGEGLERRAFEANLIELSDDDSTNSQVPLCSLSKARRMFSTRMMRDQRGIVHA